ncbi:hypothetical protein [Streptomyces broussonetiae]|uniref:Uncharacterized protein n=1 Tax=Streptomyces broussonetiae TaxID=2686304 RepID=A0A6I6N4P1_9ACTN|nr:hypothetical protein [Streptomyces broussonetiae]QHA07773.1 hypothetical protein GQF42_34670 [Streptomyces broussonetiae]
MRRTARALSVVLAAGAVLALAGPAAGADPAVRARPGPGTVSRDCASATGPLPGAESCSGRHACTDDFPCAPAGVPHGVRAGQGGSFTDSVPALVAGGILVATACAGAGHRLYGHRRITAHRPTGV